MQTAVTARAQYYFESGSGRVTNEDESHSFASCSAESSKQALRGLWRDHIVAKKTRRQLGRGEVLQRFMSSLFSYEVENYARRTQRCFSLLRHRVGGVCCISKNPMDGPKSYGAFR